MAKKQEDPLLAEQMKAMRQEQSALRKAVTLFLLLPEEVRIRILSKLVERFLPKTN